MAQTPQALGQALASTPLPTLDDEVWNELSEEIPAQNDPIIEKYLAGRTSLIEQENKRRSDHIFKTSLSPIARRACAIVERIRAEEQRTIWTPSLDEQLAQDEHISIYPGMSFTHAKGIMETTRLWKIVRRMPKGSLLHAHCDAMVDFDYLLPVLLDTPGIHIIAPASHLATPQARKDARIAFRFLKTPHGTDPSTPSIWSESYDPGTPILLSHAVSTYPGGRPAFLTWLKSRCVLSPSSATEAHHGQDHIWRAFIRCFEVVGSIIHYEPIFRAFLRRLFSQALADGTRWVELRFGWGLDYRREGSEQPAESHAAALEALADELAKFKRENPTFWGARLIWCSIRARSRRDVVADMDACIAAKMEFPEIVAGYDLVGQEDAGRPLKEWAPELLWFRQQCAQEGVTIPFFFHAGETLGSGSEADENLFDAVLLGTRRLGHALSLYKHPLLVELVREKRILVESCPISNEVLRLVGGIMSHPLPALLARGVACALCNDDPAILGHDAVGTTHDFWQALQGWENLGLAGLGELAENSVRWSNFEDQTAEEWTKGVRDAAAGEGLKAKRLKEWAVEWEQFCVWVVDEFGEDDEEKTRKN